MSIAIIDCGSGNLRSAAKAFETAADGKHQVYVTTDPIVVSNANFVVLPGVGAFGDCVTGVRNIKGMVEALEETVLQKGTPFFGICVGMQMLADKGLEHGEHKGLGWIKGSVDPLKVADPTLKIPHMGWNNLIFTQSHHPILKGFSGDEHAYFVHSYHFTCEDEKNILLQVDYDGPITAAIAKDNIIGTQFHPEKSQVFGLQLIRNFLAY